MNECFIVLYRELPSRPLRMESFADGSLAREWIDRYVASERHLGNREAWAVAIKADYLSPES